MKKVRIVLVAGLMLVGYGLNAQVLKVNPSKSEIKWDARKINGKGHPGTVTIKEGSLELADNKIKSATIIVDMNTIVNTDGKDGEPTDRLIGHLKSDDFFSVDRFPTAEFVLTGSGEFENGEAKVYGRLTIKGITQPINFVAKKENKTFSAKLSVDRTLFDVRYGSGKFFDGLGDNMIKDEFDLEIKLVTE